MTNTPVVSRLAPSPTGHLHLGHAVSFLAAFWNCRSQGGRLILRLEDLDSDRANDAHRSATIEDLRWLGIDWDGPPIVQSKRLAPIREAAHQLLETEQAYPCICTRNQVRAATLTLDPDLSAPQQGDSPEQRYPGTCKGRFVTLEEAESSGASVGLRFVTPPDAVEFEDRVFGTHRASPSRQVGDFTILRRDKTPAYQLAVVVDDHLDQVTEVVRGRDLLDSTARQILIRRALKFSPTRYLHTPLICDHSGRRLAKRHDDLSLSALRERGASAISIVRFAASCLGQSPELSTKASTISQFSVAKIPRRDVLLPLEFDQILDSLTGKR